MVYSDNTATFKDLIAQGSSRSTSPTRARDVSRARDKGKGKEGDEVFLQEAYRIVSTPTHVIQLVMTHTDGQHVHLESLTALLQTIRKPYLSITEPPIARRQRPQASGSQADDDLSRWKGSTYLSDRERDEIDLRGRMILRRCKERLYDLERSEKGQLPA